VEFLRDGGTILARGMDRLRFPAFGVYGARPAQPFRAIFNAGRPDEVEVGKLDALAVNAGDTITFLTPGASGYGDPYLRDPEKVRTDVELGFVSRAGAKRDYGVAITDSGVDARATSALRRARVKDNVHTDFDFGPEREAWEAVFDDKTMRTLNRRLAALPKSVRKDKRRWIFEHTIPGLPKPGGRPLAEVLADPDAVRVRLKAAMDTAFG
jgi:N-methylhydantoinase B